MISFTQTYLHETAAIVAELPDEPIERVAHGIATIRQRGGRLFILGVGGSAAHASHAACDFRKICDIEAYAPADNVAELTARTNDEGWDNVFVHWLEVSRAGPKDGLLVFSVGGGSREKNVSANLVGAVELARRIGASVYGIVGRDGGFTARHADAAVVIPALFRDRVTPHTEGLCAVLCHLLASHPALKRSATKWEQMQ
jgi:D-sedoheptulose 7-phosphate isomerase